MTSEMSGDVQCDGFACVHILRYGLGRPQICKKDARDRVPVAGEAIFGLILVEVVVAGFWLLRNFAFAIMSMRYTL